MNQTKMVDEDLEKTVLKKVSLRLLPYLMLIYIIAYIDRANISFAALSMNAELGFDSKTYGFAAGIFFIGYALFEIPSNILLKRFGARLWISRIMMTWGIVVILTAFITNSMQLNVLRFLLGLSEAGLFPGLILYMTYWFPRRIQAKAISMFMSAIPIALVIAGPISGWLVDHANWLGLPGWRWMFILEGAPAVLLGIVTFFFLTDAPQKAAWLQPAERTWLALTLKAEEEARSMPSHSSFFKAFCNIEVWILSLIYLASTLGGLGILYFMPTMLKSLPGNLSSLKIGLISTLPYVIALGTMNFWGRRSDRCKERVWHAALALIVPGAIFFGMGAGWFDGPLLLLVALCIVIGSAFAFNGPFWAIPPHLLTGPAAIIGIALINSIGNLGGFFGPFLIGYLKDATGSMRAGFFAFAASLLLAAALLLYLKKRHNAKSAKGSAL